MVRFRGIPYQMMAEAQKQKKLERKGPTDRKPEHHLFKRFEK